MADPNERHQSFRICAVLALLTLVAFTPVVGNDFVSFDDHEYIVENPHITPGLTWSGVVWAFSTGYASNWHPLTWISHMVDCQLYGTQPGGHHLTNLIFHTANTLLLFILLQRLTGSRWRSAFVAALFGLHPLHVESVAWASERKDTLSTLFWLLTMLAYFLYVKQSNAQSPKSKVTYGLTLFLFALGLMCKPMLVTLPFVLLLVDFWPMRRIYDLRFAIDASKAEGAGGERIGRLLLEKAPFFALAAVASCVTLLVQQSAMTKFEKLPLSTRAANAALTYFDYLGKTFWPADLAAFYPYRDHVPLFPVIVSATLLLTLTIVFVLAARRRPYLVTGWFWFLGTLVPTIGLIQVGSQSMADRYMYIPSIGLFIALVWGLAELSSSSPSSRNALVGAGAAAVIACGALSFVQAGYWRNSITLYTHAIAVTKDNYIAYNGLGGALTETKDYPGALKWLKKTVAIKPRYAEGQYNLGTVYLEDGHPADSIVPFEAALAANSNYAQAHANLGRALLALNKPDEAYSHLLKAVDLKPDYALGHYNLGTFYLNRSKVAEAIDEFSRAIRLNPAYAEAHANLGVALIQAGRGPEGIAELARASNLKPDVPNYHANLALALAEAKRWDEAEAEFSQVVKLKPDDFHAHYNLGTILLRRSKLTGAIDEFSQTVRLKPDYADAYANLGAALMAANRIEEAANAFTRATQLKPDDFDNHYNLASALARLHKSRDAAASFRAALQVKPDSVEAMNSLSWLLSTDPDPQQRNGSQALQLAGKACELTGNRAAIPLLTLANAQAESGQFADAIATARKARELASSAGQKDAVARADQLLELFGAGKAFHEPQ